MSGCKLKNTGGNSITVNKRKRCSFSKHSVDLHENSIRLESKPRPLKVQTLKSRRSLAPGRISKSQWPNKSSRRRGRRKERISSCVEREWVSSASNFENVKGKVVLVSYNLLGVDNASNHMDLYYNIPPKHLEWSRRKHLICKEISRYNANILCLQEVDRFDDLDGLLKNRGFKVFTRVELEKQVMVVLYSGKRKQTSTSCQRLVVGNIHVLFNPKRGDIKLGQVRLFLEKAYKLSQEWGDIPVALAGDLNSTPQSAIYDFIASADLDTQLHDRRQISGQSEVEPKERSFRNHYAVSAAVSISISIPNEWSQEELQLATGGHTTTHVQHQLKLHSAYSGVPGN